MEKELKSITLDEIEQKRQNLEKEYNREIYAHCFENENGEKIVGFFKNPDRLVKMRALDMSLQSWTNSADILLKTSLITEHSDSRILSEKSEHDAIYFSFLLKANDLVKFYSEQQKKK